MKKVIHGSFMVENNKLEPLDADFENWYWSYGYGSKIACIKAVEASDLPEEEKKIRIAYHEKNMGKYEDE